MTVLHPQTRPLVVDADRALLKTNLFWEALLALMSATPRQALFAFLTLRRGCAAFREAVFGRSGVAVESLPLNTEVAELARSAAAGRPVHLASSHQTAQVQALAARLGLQPRVFVSKADLVEAFGDCGFDYIDRPPAPLERMGVGARTKALIRALRCHQWTKNLLIFVPALGAHQFGAGLVLSLIGFVSFSLCASSVYLINDLLDLKADRAHPRKKTRALAAGDLPIQAALAAAILLLAIAAGLGLLLPPLFLAVLAGYYVLTLAYSVALKRRAIVDVLVLACLYGARLLAGSAATSTPLSPWLVTLSTFLFLSLALVKRCAELTDQSAPGDRFTRRGYRPTDLPMLLGMAAASGYLSALVFVLYVNSEDVGLLYPHPQRLWLIGIFILYWVSHVLLKTHRGEMHDDPVVFAFKDRSSWLCGVVAGAIVASALF